MKHTRQAQATYNFRGTFFLKVTLGFNLSYDFQNLQAAFFEFKGNSAAML